MPLAAVDVEFYFQHLFPIQHFHRWLSYGDTDCFRRREFSMTLPGDIYIRFRSFEDGEELKKELVRKKPDKMDIGGIYNVQPKLKDAHATFHALEKEVVFDIDISDYDDVRVCCQDKRICNKCWPLMTCAIQILQNLLTEDFGYEHLLFVFSGRRGVHCWCCDRPARQLTDEERAALANYLNVYEGGESQKLNIEYSLKQNKLHPSLERVYHQFIEPGFAALFLSEDNEPNNIRAAKTTQSIVTILSRQLKGFNTDMKDKVHKILAAEKTCTKLWTDLTAYLAKEKVAWVIRIIEFVFMYPRLDINVSKQRAHLLKSPFVIHPGSGKVCVPLSLSQALEFEPEQVPTLTEVIEGHAQDVDVLEQYRHTFVTFVDNLVAVKTEAN
eukprot:NODE_2247_length_1237_cov_51.669369_g2136_i0.p1 GENE.NODE_2247_length_1237_cov_51.669369_g2136_i0~~NODE_2247_length_1237_cov_51.669369_g2136_i0.p1  ORF type:complete len:391 (+),score=118.75 NODE_2247_length_1237_cov_51.669369_g2136_i0:23-1174(+)